MTRVVIVGAGAGGDATALALRKQGFAGDVVLIGAESHPPYERPYLSKQFLRSEIPDEKVFLRPDGEYQRQNIDLRLSVRAVAADRERQEIVLDSGQILHYDSLVLATGSAPRWLPDTPRASNMFALRTLAEATSLREEIRSAERVLLVGAGFIGAEIAASARLMNKEVTIVEVASVPLERALGRDIGQWYARMHAAHGVDIRLNTAVEEWLIDGDRLTEVQLSDGSRQRVDVAVVAVGVSPNLDLASQLDLTVGAEGLYVNECLEAAPNVYAIGDIAAHQHPIYNRRLRVEHWQVAQRQGVAVAAMITTSPAPYRELPWFWSDQYDVNLQYLGNASGSDEEIVRGDIQGDGFSLFYLREGIIDAVLSINDGRTGRFSRDLINNRTRVPSSVLADVESDLRALAKAASKQ